MGLASKNHSTGEDQLQFTCNLPDSVLKEVSFEALTAVIVQIVVFPVMIQGGVVGRY
jgi:hypothetical protein